MSLQEKCEAINEIVGTYFSINKSVTSIQACTLYKDNRGMKYLFSSEKTMRDVFRKLDEAKAMSLIPYLKKEEIREGRRNWFFLRIK